MRDDQLAVVERRDTGGGVVTWRARCRCGYVVQRSKREAVEWIIEQHLSYAHDATVVETRRTKGEGE